MSVDEINHSKLVWKISGGLSAMVIVAAGFLYLDSHDYKLFPSSSEDNNTAEESIEEKALEEKALEEKTVEDKVEVEPVIASTNETIAKESELLPENDKPLVEASILKQEIPKNASIAKDEISKLDDIHDQLKTQKSMLEEQQKDADQIIQLKEEQIKLLEAELNARN